MEHSFTPVLKPVLVKHYGEHLAAAIFDNSLLIQYLNIKTKSADRGSKARGSFANLYAIYVLVEDYLKHSFDKRGDYKNYEGARFSELFSRQRQLPFGSKLQNHALNSRCNEEFRKYFPTTESVPIIRDLESNRYWVNEKLLTVNVGTRQVNLAPAIAALIEEYVKAKQSSFDKFIEYCEGLKHLEENGKGQRLEFIKSQLAPNVDARIFEIMSYSILKYFYHNQIVYFGLDLDELQQEPLKLYKTGRTNANDGGIDFVMKPLGRFFQVTETTDVRKYFLDIDKLEHFPVTFVVKSTDTVESLREGIKRKAEEQYPVKMVTERYMKCVEEIINVPALLERFDEAVRNGYLGDILEEVIKQSKVEFNYPEEEG